jgi:hypothetical protein
MLGPAPSQTIVHFNKLKNVLASLESVYNVPTDLPMVRGLEIRYWGRFLRNTHQQCEIMMRNYATYSTLSSEGLRGRKLNEQLNLPLMLAGDQLHPVREEI